MQRLIFFIVFFLSILFQAEGSVDDSTKTKRVKVIGFPLLGYEPETRWYTGALALFTVRFYEDSVTRFSNFKTEFNITQNKQLIFENDHNVFLKEESYYLFGKNAFLKFPENFYGIGNSTPDTALEKYSTKRLELSNTFLKRFSKVLYAGITYRMQYMYDLEPTAGKILAEQPITGNRGGTSSGLGLTVNFDKRKNILNPKSGYFLSFSGVFFQKFLGSDFQFSRFEIDGRKYIPVFKNKWKDQVIAFQAFGIFNAGNPPFRMMSLLGSDAHMRGYYTGRFRDKNYIALQGEYRLRVYRAFGLAGFAGLGDVADQLNHFNLSEFKPTVGLGLRIRADKKDDVNMRFDFAWGKNMTGFYVVFGEAF